MTSCSRARRFGVATTGAGEAICRGRALGGVGCCVLDTDVEFEDDDDEDDAAAAEGVEADDRE